MWCVSRGTALPCPHAAQGNTGVYLLYSKARINSIFRRPELQGIDWASLRDTPILLEHPKVCWRVRCWWTWNHCAKEIKLAQHIARFQAAIARLMKVQ
jgi:arginyl-tRNA synthetase